MNITYTYKHIDREREREERTWKVEGVERKRVERFPQTKAEELMPDKIPNTDARRFSGTLSAYNFKAGHWWMQAIKGFLIFHEAIRPIKPVWLGRLSIAIDRSKEMMKFLPRFPKPNYGLS